MVAGLVALSSCGGDEDTSGAIDENAITFGDISRGENAQGDGPFVMGVSAEITASPSPLSFDQTAIGSANTQIITIRNASSRTNLRISELTLRESGDDRERELRAVPSEDADNPGAAELLAASRAGREIVVAPATSFDMQFEWAPKNRERDSGTLTFTTNDPARRTFTVDLQTPSLAPDLVAPSSVRFGRAPKGQSLERIVNLTNNGQAPLVIDGVTLNPRNAPDFAISFPTEGNRMDASQDMQEPKRVLEPDETIEMRVTFTPFNSNESTGTSIFIYSNDPEDNGQEVIELSGNADAPCLELVGAAPIASVEPNADGDLSTGEPTHNLTFGESTLGRTSTRSLTLRNCSPTFDLELSNLGVLGAGPYTLTLEGLPEGIQTDDGHVLLAQENIPVRLEYTPTAVNDEPDRAIFGFLTNDAANPEVRVELEGRGTDNQCPTAIGEAYLRGETPIGATEILAEPLNYIVLNGEGSVDSDGEVSSYEWIVRSRPSTDSTSRPVAQNDSGSVVELQLDLAGEYVVELNVVDNRGLQSCEPSVITINAKPDQDILVELTWDTPADPDQTDTTGTDLDLHYLNEQWRSANWGSAPADIYYDNPTADWGPNGIADNVDANDPSLDIDDRDGAGPENIQHDRPPTGTYLVGVSYYNDGGFGSSIATVRIYIRGNLVETIKGIYFEERFQFREIARISWPSGDVNVLNRLIDSPE